MPQAPGTSCNTSMPFCWRRQWWKNNSKVARIWFNLTFYLVSYPFGDVFKYQFFGQTWLSWLDFWRKTVVPCCPSVLILPLWGALIIYVFYVADDLTSQRFVKFRLDVYCKNMKGAAPESYFVGCKQVDVLRSFPKMSRNFLKTWDEMCLGTKGMMETSKNPMTTQPSKFHPSGQHLIEFREEEFHQMGRGT